MTAPPYTETCHIFDVAGESLVGVLSRPATECDTALLIVVGGPQYRAGSHRQFVELARSVAAGGHAVLRFDHRGMGDSGGAMRSFEQISDDIAAAIDFLFKQLPGLRRVVLWGLCDGASAALLYLDDRNDDRVVGVALINPWVRSAQTLARAHVKHYYTRRLREKEFWVKLVSGKVAWTALRNVFENLVRSRAAETRSEDRDCNFQARMRGAWTGFEGPLLVVLSGNDYTAKEFIELCESDKQWAGNLRRPNVSRFDQEKADHTFSERTEQAALTRTTVGWLVQLASKGRNQRQPPLGERTQGVG